MPDRKEAATGEREESQAAIRPCSSPTETSGPYCANCGWLLARHAAVISESDKWQTKGHEEQVYIDNHGVLRYRANPVIQWLVNRSSVADPRLLSVMAVACAQGAFPLEDYMQFYRDMGYSLGGFEEIFGKYFDDDGGRIIPVEDAP